MLIEEAHNDLIDPRAHKEPKILQLQAQTVGGQIFHHPLLNNNRRRSPYNDLAKFPSKLHLHNSERVCAGGVQLSE